MKAVLGIAGAVIAAAAGYAWLSWEADTAPESMTRVAAPVASEPSSRTNAGAAVASIVPRPPAKKSVFDELLATRRYAGLYERLNGTPEGATPKGRLVMYELLRECATVKDAPWPVGQRYAMRFKRDNFAESLAPGDPRREQRIAAYQKFTENRCVDFPQVALSWEELQAYLREAAVGGEPAARAMLIENELWGAGRGANASPTDAQIGALEEAAHSHDPEAIRVAGRVLANPWKDYALRVGPDELPVEPRPFVSAWLVLACEYGAPCGPDTPRMQQYCAFQGYCDAQSFPDYLAYYGASPHDATMLMQYRALIRAAIESGDWSQIRVLRGQPQGADRMTFVPGPR